jgi:hypothetical protein
MLQIWSTSHIDYKKPIFYFMVHSFISLYSSSLSYLRLPLLINFSLHIFISISLAISISLRIAVIADKIYFK